MAKTLATLFVLAGLTVVSAPWLQAHHSNVAFEVTKVVTVKGAVKGFRWTNPHTWLYVTITDEKGVAAEWAFEGRAPGILARAGWSRDVFGVGEVVTVDMSPAKDGSHTGMIARVIKADGTILGGLPLD